MEFFPWISGRKKIVNSGESGAPVFYSRAGEVLPLPPLFEEAVRKTTAAVCCVGCKHTHVGVPPMVVVNHVTEKEQPA
jgi:hypothetical protein